jgi:hypothetical protein
MSEKRFARLKSFWRGPRLDAERFDAPPKQQLSYSQFSEEIGRSLADCFEQEQEATTASEESRSALGEALLEALSKMKKDDAPEAPPAVALMVAPEPANDEKSEVVVELTPKPMVKPAPPTSLRGRLEALNKVRATGT